MSKYACFGSPTGGWLRVRGTHAERALRGTHAERALRGTHAERAPRALPIRESADTNRQVDNSTYQFQVKFYPIYIKVTFLKYLN